MNTTRLRELCDAFDAGTLRDEEMRELVGLAREAARIIIMALVAAHAWNAIREISRASFDHKEAIRVCAKELLRIVGE